MYLIVHFPETTELNCSNTLSMMMSGLWALFWRKRLSLSFWSHSFNCPNGTRAWHRMLGWHGPSCLLSHGCVILGSKSLVEYALQWAKLGTGFSLACAQTQFQRSIVFRVFFSLEVSNKKLQ